MKTSNALSIRGSFEILETTKRSQTAALALEVGEATSDQPNRHPESDQVLIVLEGELAGEIGGEKLPLKVGDSVIVKANTPHRFVNSGKARAVAFSVYAPPAYPPGTKE